MIVYIDDCFDVEGPSYLLNKEFQRIIGEKKFSFYKYIFQEARKIGYELKRYVGLMKFLRIWRCWIVKGYDE